MDYSNICVFAYDGAFQVEIPTSNFKLIICCKQSLKMDLCYIYRFNVFYICSDFDIDNINEQLLYEFQKYEKHVFERKVITWVLQYNKQHNLKNILLKLIGV